MFVGVDRVREWGSEGKSAERGNPYSITPHCNTSHTLPHSNMSHSHTHTRTLTHSLTHSLTYLLTDESATPLFFVPACMASGKSFFLNKFITPFFKFSKCSAMIQTDEHKVSKYSEKVSEWVSEWMSDSLATTTTQQSPTAIIRIPEQISNAWCKTQY